MMTVVYSLSRRDEEARAEADDVFRTQPEFSLEKFEKNSHTKGKLIESGFLEPCAKRD